MVCGCSDLIRAACRWAAIVMVAAGTLATTLARPAMASCSGTNIHYGVGGVDNTSTLFRGTKADIYVNNFSTHQYKVARNLSVYQNSNNFAEVGWAVVDSVDQNKHPYKTWVSDGVDKTVIASASLPGDSAVSFKVHDDNDDKYWSFAWNGNALGNQYANFHLGRSRAQSERWCTSDSAWGHHFNLQHLVYINGSWDDFGGLSQDVAGDPDYNFCWTSKTEFYVKQTC